MSMYRRRAIVIGCLGLAKSNVTSRALVIEIIEVGRPDVQLLRRRR